MVRSEHVSFFIQAVVPEETHVLTISPNPCEQEPVVRGAWQAILVTAAQDPFSSCSLIAGWTAVRGPYTHTSCVTKRLRKAEE